MLRVIFRSNDVLLFDDKKLKRSDIELQIHDLMLRRDALSGYRVYVIGPLLDRIFTLLTNNPNRPRQPRYLSEYYYFIRLSSNGAPLQLFNVTEARHQSLLRFRDRDCLLLLKRWQRLRVYVGESMLNNDNTILLPIDMAWSCRTVATRVLSYLFKSPEFSDCYALCLLNDSFAGIHGCPTNDWIGLGQYVLNSDIIRKTNFDNVKPDLRKVRWCWLDEQYKRLYDIETTSWCACWLRKRFFDLRVDCCLLDTSTQRYDLYNDVSELLQTLLYISCKIERNDHLLKTLTNGVFDSVQELIKRTRAVLHDVVFRFDHQSQQQLFNIYLTEKFVNHARKLSDCKILGLKIFSPVRILTESFLPISVIPHKLLFLCMSLPSIQNGRYRLKEPATNSFSLKILKNKSIQAIDSTLSVRFSEEVVWHLKRSSSASLFGKFRNKKDSSDLSSIQFSAYSIETNATDIITNLFAVTTFNLIDANDTTLTLHGAGVRSLLIYLTMLTNRKKSVTARTMETTAATTTSTTATTSQVKQLDDLISLLEPLSNEKTIVVDSLVKQQKPLERRTRLVSSSTTDNATTNTAIAAAPAIVDSTKKNKRVIASSSISHTKTGEGGTVIKMTRHCVSCPLHEINVHYCKLTKINNFFSGFTDNSDFTMSYFNEFIAVSTLLLVSTNTVNYCDNNCLRHEDATRVDRALHLAQLFYLQLPHLLRRFVTDKQQIQAMLSLVKSN